jgi:trimethyllysine dioxygenase
MIHHLHTHGFIRITTTAAADNEKVTRPLLTEMFGPIRRTFYGDMWHFSADAAMEDTAYSTQLLEPHTDGTYFSHCPGLQVLQCLNHTGGSGGETVLVDGLAVVQQLRKLHPDDYQFLLNETIPVRHDGDGMHLYQERPVLDVCDEALRRNPADDDGLIQLRFNDNDRCIKRFQRPEDAEKYYHALGSLLALTRQRENQHWFLLRRNELLIVDNWRVLHGRASFTGHRTIGGCYIDRDDYISALHRHRKAFKNHSQIV